MKEGVVCKVQWSDKKFYTSKVLAIGTKVNLEVIQKQHVQTGSERETDAEREEYGKRIEKKTTAHPPPKVW